MIRPEQTTGTTQYSVTVFTEDDSNPPFTVKLRADSEGKAKTAAMACYPHPLRGQMMEYSVTALPPIKEWKRGGVHLFRVVVPYGFLPEALYEEIAHRAGMASAGDLRTHAVTSWQWTTAGYEHTFAV